MLPISIRARRLHAGLVFAEEIAPLEPSESAVGIDLGGELDTRTLGRRAGKRAGPRTAAPRARAEAARWPTSSGTA